MESVKKVRLSDISELITKGTTPTTLGYEFQDEGVNFLKIECFDEYGGFVEDKLAHISDECNKKLKRSQLQAGDILFSIAGAIGRVAIVTEQMLPANTNQALAIIRINRDDVYIPYIRLLLTTPIVKKQFERKKQGVAQLNISLKDINELTIPLPNKIQQIQYVSLLNRIDGVINARRLELKKLDELIKARFVEMSQDWDVESIPLSEYLEDITYGFTNPMPDAEEGPWKITAKDVVNGKINYETARKTTQEAYDSLTAKSKPIIGDVLLTKDGTLGRVAIVEDENICVNQSVAVLRCNKRVLSRFLTLLLQLPEYQTEMTKNSGGGTIKHIYITKVDKMLVRIPQIVFQKDYINFVTQVDKSKTEVQKSLDEAQLLFDSLMQQYFG